MSKLGSRRLPPRLELQQKTKRMKQFFGKNFIIFLSLIFVSCSPKNDQPPKLRIVDLDGKSHSVVTKVPELNKQAMMSQGVYNQQSSAFQNNPTSTSQEQNIAASAPDYGTVSSEIVQQTLQPKPQIQPTPEQEQMVAAGKQSEEAIEYDLSKPEEDAKPEVKVAEPKKPAKKISISKVSSKTSNKGLFVQVGSFASISNANNTLEKMSAFHKGKVVETTAGDKTIYRVLLGPFTSKPKALALVKKITDSGHEAVLMRNK